LPVRYDQVKEADMDNVERPATPVHLWIVGILAVLWNAFGCYDYFMTRTQGADYIHAMMPTVDASAMMDYINGFPIWASIGWGLGVWGGLLGSILLMMRNRMALTVLGLSLAGALVGLGYQLAAPPAIAGMHDGPNAYMPYVIIAVALGLVLYARAMIVRGVLR
jgi:hypothetical protein